MRIVAFVPYYPPFSRVGAWLATHEILMGLVCRKHRVKVRTSAGFESGKYDGIDVRPVGPNFAPHMKNVDLVISHAGDMYAKQIDHVAQGKPHIKVVHSVSAASQVPEADLLVFNSDSTRNSVDWPSDSIVVRPRTRPAMHRVAQTGSRVTLVNMSPEKGGQIFRQIAAREPHRKFLGVVGGHGSQVRVSVEESNVALLQPQADMREVWRQTRILLMPSESETWGMVGVEAMCSGIPVIAHPTPGLQESLGDAGIFVCREDVYGWRREIARLDDPLVYAQQSAAAIARAGEIAGFDDIERFCVEIEGRFG